MYSLDDAAQCKATPASDPHPSASSASDPVTPSLHAPSSDEQSQLTLPPQQQQENQTTMQGQGDQLSAKMSSLADSSQSGPAIKGSGLLLTHNWTQLHTPHGLLDLAETIPVEDSDYKTVNFPISSVSQFEACITGKMICSDGLPSVKGCPLFESSADSCSVGSSRPLSAVVRVTYKQTHLVSDCQDGLLSKNAISALQPIMHKVLEQKELVQEDISAFLHKFGSHFQSGAQTLGKAFVRVVVVNKTCDVKLLAEIAEEIFAICDEYEQYFASTQEGSWYSPKEFFNTLAWTKEKKQVLEAAKLRISHIGIQAKTSSLSQWRNDVEDEPQNLSGMDSRNILSVWDLIPTSWRQFQNHTKLSAVIKEGWERIVSASKHQDVIIPQDPPTISIPGIDHSMCHLVEELGMEKFFPCKLSTQEVRCLQSKQEVCEKKEELVWRVLEQLMLTNPQCREQDIDNYKTAQQANQPKKRIRPSKFNSTFKATQLPTVPHPMDVLLLLFTCSDFMLRQVLARKLFLCRLAIPFIIPATAKETVEMLIWPLRSIIMEWVNKEEALIKCKLNMVTFMRCGKTKFSKSKLLNTLLSPSGHPTFFHQELPCGNLKRTISNGTVEMSHYLPGESQQNQFTEPALFFNLRGDACDHPVQHQVLMDLPTTVVIFVDIGELNDQQVQQTLKTTFVKKKQDAIVVLTDSKKHEEENIEQLMESFFELAGDEIDIERDIVTTFEIEGGQKNISDMNKEIKDAIAAKFFSGSQQSIESLGKLALSQCQVDENENHHCSTGKEVAEKLLEVLKQQNECERKEKLLPQQGDCLHKIGKLLRRLHRSSGEDLSTKNKEAIKQRIKDIRQQQSATLNDDEFVIKVISLFHHSEETKLFAIRWIQLELDAISRTILPGLQADKNTKWKALTKARGQRNTPQIAELETKFHEAEKRLAAASFGWEHLMREVGQLFEVSKELKMMDKAGSMFHLSTLPEIVGKQLMDGHPVELMDGDHGFIPIEWVKAVFHSLAQLAGPDKNIFVLSVMGIQSSGKSTLLNTMFGLEFAVSAGRCTRGIYAQLLNVAGREDLPFDYILVLDSEGLKSQELENQNFEHDNELATLVMGLADLALINLKGENVREITEVLQIVVHAFLRMKLADSPQKRQCMFVHQNVSAINAQEKLAGDRQKLIEELDRMTQEASIALGLSSETIMSFNQIISFDCDRDVVYFADLWNGNPPMATVNQGYSMRASHTRQNMLEQIPNNFKGFITIPAFISRMEDMWNGVLADDFIFSFRSTLAAKSYIEVERECARLTLLVEQELLHWMNTDCKVQMENTKSENELHHRHGELKMHLQSRVASLITQNLTVLEDFFVKHPASEIIVQWKSEKRASFTLYCKKLGNQREADLQNMKLRKLFHIRQGSEAYTHEQEIIKKAISVAEKMRGKCPPDKELNIQFDDLWESWAAHLMSTSSQIQINALADFQAILWHDRYSDMIQFFNEQTEHTPFVQAEDKKTITADGLVKEHIIVKAKPSWFKVPWGHRSRADYLDAALQKANAIVQLVTEEALAICAQDIMFNPLHGRQIIDHLFEEITKHNNLPFDKVQYVFNQRFKAMMAIHVACCTAPMFDRMSQQFEEKHGVHAQMQAYRRRVFLLFKNTVKNTSAEVIASEDFCEAMKGKMIEHVKLQLEQSVQKELNIEFGIKYDLIIKMLDDIAQREITNDTEKNANCKALMEYVHKPFEYAKMWVKKTSDIVLFHHDNGASKYSKLAEPIMGRLVSKIVASASEATATVATGPMTQQTNTSESTGTVATEPMAQQTDQYNAWITAFCDNIKDMLTLNEDQLRLNTSVTSFQNFQNFLEVDLERLEKDVQASFSEEDEDSVEWPEKVSPYEKVLKRLWGCTELCPFCSEPCQHSDPDHGSCHRCVQHRPLGVRGSSYDHSKLLALETCSVLITTRAIHMCAECRKQCRQTIHCNRTDKDKDYSIHPFRQYKKFLPNWDIAPDAAESASKFWQWAMCTFQKEILERYKETKLEIPESWKKVTSKEASDSLRLYRS